MELIFTLSVGRFFGYRPHPNRRFMATCWISKTPR